MTSPATSTSIQLPVAVCQATRKDGNPCRAPAGPNGLCVGHRPGAQAARSRGGHNHARHVRLEKLAPPRLIALYSRLEDVLDGLGSGTIPPSRGTAMASVASVMIRALSVGELEERVRKLEGVAGGRGNGARPR